MELYSKLPWLKIQCSSENMTPVIKLPANLEASEVINVELTENGNKVTEFTSLVQLIRVARR